MASKIAYGVQFEALMAEVCRDFGYKLVKSWEADRGMPLDKSEIRDFVAEAVTNFFSIEPVVEEEEVEVEKPKKKASAKKKASDKAVALDVTVEVDKPKPKPKSKGKAPEPEEPAEEETPTKAAKGKAAKGKGKAVAKPKCQAVTAKGTPCSKCAVDGEPFCNIHMKKAPVESTKSVAKASSSKAHVEKPKGKGGKGLKKASPPKHTHGLTSPPLKENPCELCDTHGMPFEVPEYEEDKASALDAEIEDAEVEMAYDPTDPDFVLGEEDFDESDSDSDMDDLD